MVQEKQEEGRGMFWTILAVGLGAHGWWSESWVEIGFGIFAGVIGVRRAVMQWDKPSAFANCVATVVAFGFLIASMIANDHAGARVRQERAEAVPARPQVASPTRPLPASSPALEPPPMPAPEPRTSGKGFLTPTLVTKNGLPINPDPSGTFEFEKANNCAIRISDQLEKGFDVWEDPPYSIEYLNSSGSTWEPYGWHTLQGNEELVWGAQKLRGKVKNGIYIYLNEYCRKEPSSNYAFVPFEGVVDGGKVTGLISKTLRFEEGKGAGWCYLRLKFWSFNPADHIMLNITSIIGAKRREPYNPLRLAQGIREVQIDTNGESYKDMQYTLECPAFH